MTTFSQLIDQTLQVLQGFGLQQPRATFLDQPVNETDLVWNVRDTTSFSQGVAEIGSEIVFVESVDDDAKTVTIAPDGRGYYGTPASAHPANTRLTANPPFPRNRVKDALNDAVIGTWPVLFGQDQHQFTYNAVVNTYSLPDDVESVLLVTADTIGPTREQQVVRRYAFDSNAPLDEWISGNTITLQEGCFPGVTVTVTYRKKPSMLSEEQEFSESGLQETAKVAVKYAAASQLVTLMDPAYLTVASAESEAYDERNPLGTASRIANQLYARYELELDLERRRLRATSPVPINVRNR